MLTEIPASDWRQLILSALKFSAVSPWEWVLDSQVFGVQLRESGEKIYCSVMGGAGELKAIAMYPGKSGWKSYLDLGSEGMDTDPNELIVRQRCLFTSFLPANEAEADDLALMKHVGQAIDAEQLIPSFRSYRPGYVPLPPDRAEIKVMQEVFARALALMSELPGAAVTLPEEGLDESGRLLFSVAAADSSDWQMEWLLPDATMDFSPAVVALTAEEKQQTLALPRKEGIWLVESFYLTEAAQDETGVAFFPHAFVFFDLQVQEFRGVSLLQPDDYPDMVGTVLCEMLQQQGSRPTQIVVSKRPYLILLRSFCQALGIGIHLEEELDILPALREAVEESMDFSDR